MTQHEFIFSNQFRHRLLRHAAFCISCWLFFFLTYYVPSCVLPGWNTEKFASNISRLGFVEWFWWRIFNSTITFIPILIFAYSVIYLVIHRHVFTKKNGIYTAGMMLGVLVLVLAAHYYGGWLISWNNQRLNPARKMPVSMGLYNYGTKSGLLNYPVIAGFAVIIKMMKRSWLKQQETRQIAIEKAKAELQLLKSQIHPHFLFNTLNNIYFFTLTASQKAPEILTKLKDILRYILDECGHPLVPLENELKMVKDYMSLEKIRYGDQLKMDLEIKGDSSNKMIPPLLLLPLIENSFKHGASKMLEQPWVNLNITVEGDYLYFILSNSRPVEINLSLQTGRIGLNNVKKRLKLLYPYTHELNIAESQLSFEIFMKIRWADHNKISTDKKIKAGQNEFTLA